MNNMPRDPVIATACRTPIGRLRGGLSQVRPDDLLAHVFEEAIKRAGLAADDVDEVFAGCANQAGEDNRNVARMATLLAGMPNSVPAVTVNRLCASGLEAIAQASRLIRLDEADICVAGGVESMTRAPFAMAKPAVGFPIGAPDVFDTSLGWRFPNPKMKTLFPLEAMGQTAENLVDEYGISREDQDLFALQSHQKALAAQKAGWFDAETVEVAVPQRKGDPVVVSQDEGPRADTAMEKLARLRPAFKEGGTVTAGNSSTLNDGASALVVCAREVAEAKGLKVRATIRGATSAGVDPRTMGIGPVPATRKLMQRCDIALGDIDIIELNEAFAAQSLAVIRALELDVERVNISGGAIALGHPLGCSGARIVTTLLHALERTEGRLGLATLCVGVGQGMAMLIEREG